MVRGSERTTVFRDDRDRGDFIARLARLAEAGAVTVYAWALLPNYAHLLVRTGARPLPRSLRSLLTGDAGACNRRHTRVGHLFQNRDRSIVVEGFQPRRSRGAAGCRRSRVRARGSPTFGWSAWAARGGRSRPSWAFTRLPCIRRPAGGPPRPRSGSTS